MASAHRLVDFKNWNGSTGKCRLIDNASPDVVLIACMQSASAPEATALRTVVRRGDRLAKTLFRTVHRYLGRCAAALWILQAVTGMLLVFHQPIDASALREFDAPAHLKSLDASLHELASRFPGSRSLEYFPAGGAPGQTDVVIDRPGGIQAVVRLRDSSGAIVSVNAWVSPWWRLGFFGLVTLFHERLLGGTLGRWLIAASGILLTLNVLMGLRLAWPPRGQWRAALIPRRSKAKSAAVWGWHRALGLWLAPLGLVAASTGAILAGTASLQPGGTDTPIHIKHPVKPDDPALPSSAAAAAALARYPDATLSVVSMPHQDDPWYTIRMRRSGELRRVFGTTVVYVNPANGAIIGIQDALAATPAARFLADLYPVHTGEWGGFATRLVAFTGGLWITATAALGLTLWWTRRRARRAGTRSTC